MKRQLLTSFMLAFGAHIHSADISVITYNIRRAGSEAHAYRQWNHRKTEMIRTLQKAADILCLQEVTHEQLHDLQRGLETEYNSVCVRGRGKSWGKNEAVPIFYNKSRFSLVASNTFRLNPLHKGIERFKALFHPKRHGLLPRICGWTVLREQTSGRIILVCNAHLDHKYEQARINGLKKISQCVHKLQGRYKPDVTLLVGDFNTDLTPRIVQYTGTFVDTKKTAQEYTGPRYTHPGWDHDQNSNIDHVLVHANKPTSIDKVEVIDYSRTGLLLSDHWPVRAQLHIT